MTDKITLFDTHCHLDFPEFKNNLKKMIIKAEDVGISGILIPGVKKGGWRSIRQIAAQHSICHTALGLHPLFIEEHRSTDLHDLEMALSIGSVAAIGKIGLDFHNAGSNRSLQVHFFTAQISLAKIADLPVVLHVRKAHDEVIKIITQLKFKGGGIIHAFNGSEHQAKKYCDLGFKLGFGGAMTFLRAAKLHRLASTLPLDSIVLETNAPGMAPVSCKTKFNTPLHLFDNFKYLITLRPEPAAEVARQTTINAINVLKIG